MLWVAIAGVIGLIAWVLYAHRKLGKPLPKFMKISIITLIICVSLIIVLEILLRFV